MPIKDSKRRKEYEKARQSTIEFKERRKNYERNKRKNNILFYKKYSASLRLKALKTVYSHYGEMCACCGETQPMFLTIDHINNDGNKFVDSSGRRICGYRLMRWIIRNNFPDTLQLLCMNCNLGKFRNGGICPHKILTQ